MRRLQAILQPRGVRLQVEVPQTRRERMRGLLRRDGLVPGSVLLLERTRSIHTIGMRFALTIAFLDERNTVIEVRRVGRTRVLFPRFHARHVLECRSDEDVRVGDRVAYERSARTIT
jgi:hypothetical protein